jgi:hemerythrin-like metal-binding protein
MALIEWSDKLTLGVDRMDDTHREFVDLLNTLHAASDDDYIALLDQFIEHTVTHFEQEKRWMTEIDFPPAHCHLNEHEGVLNIMREVRRMVAEGKREVGRVLTRELAPWFENHAATMDATLAFFLRCIDAGVDPMQAIAAQDSPSLCAHGAGAACGHDAATCSADAETPSNATTART